VFGEDGMGLFWLGGQGFKDVPHWAYLYLVTTLKLPPEDLVGLRSVQKVGLWNDKLVTFVRIYDPRASEQTLQVEDFTSLDLHPEFVLYEGYWEKASDRVFLEHRPTLKPQSQ